MALFLHSSEMEVGAVLRGPIGAETLIVERLVLPCKPYILVATSIIDPQGSAANSEVPI